MEELPKFKEKTYTVDGQEMIAFIEQTKDKSEREYMEVVEDEKIPNWLKKHPKKEQKPLTESQRGDLKEKAEFHRRKKSETRKYF